MLGTVTHWLENSWFNSAKDHFNWFLLLIPFNIRHPYSEKDSFGGRVHHTRNQKATIKVIYNFPEGVKNISTFPINFNSSAYLLHLFLQIVWQCLIIFSWLEQFNNASKYPTVNSTTILPKTFHVTALHLGQNKFIIILNCTYFSFRMISSKLIWCILIKMRSKVSVCFKVFLWN